MKTVFVLTYYILLSTKIYNADFIEIKQKECVSFQAALDEYNKAMRDNYTIAPDIKKIEVKDSTVAK
jgi:hypothetical protein